MSDNEEQEVIHRPSLDDETGDNDNEESEEEIGSRSNRQVDDDEEEEEEIVEATDAELLKEIEKDKILLEQQKAEFERVKAEMLANGSLSVNDTYTFELNGSSDIQSTYQIPGIDLEADPNAQLTTFQENIITTGSGASVVLLVILCIMFIVQCVRKLWEYYNNQKIEDSIDDVLTELKPERAEDHTMEATAYVVYNTPFDERELYEKRQREGADLTELQQILEQRAIRVILRGTKIQEDSQGIKKNWQMDMVPRDVWDDFSAAQANVQREFGLIDHENKEKQFNWGPPFEHNIFAYAKEKIQRERKRQMMQHMSQRRAMHSQNAPTQAPPGTERTTPTAQSMIRNVPQGPSATNTPSSRGFGKGFNKGFLNQNRPPQKEKLTRRQKKKLKAQQGADGQAPPPQPGLGDPAADPNVFATANEFNPQAAQTAQTHPVKRKKGKRRMK